MSRRHTSRLTRRAANTAMGRRRTSGSTGLDTLLSDAAAPARAGELSGEGAALVAFQQARLSPTPPVTFMKRRTSRLLTAKVLAVGVIAVSSTGGLALAAGNGHLPGIGTSADAPNHGEAAIERPALDSSATASTDLPAEPVVEPADDYDASGPSEGKASEPKASPSPSPSLEGLCTAFAAGGSPKEKSKRLESPAFSALVEAAGGAENVEAYCVEVDVTPAEEALDRAGAEAAVPGKSNEDRTTLRRVVPTQAADAIRKKKAAPTLEPVKPVRKPVAPAPPRAP